MAVTRGGRPEIVFVDGHNALHVLGVDAGGHEADRGALLREVRERVRRLEPGATVFFDGYPPSGAFGATTDRGLRIVFSGGREADDAIVDEVRAAERPGRVVVVTDDMPLARRVAQLGAKARRVRDFFAPAREDPAEADEKPSDSGGFTAADFGLPEAIDLDDPAHRRGVRPPRRPRR